MRRREVLKRRFKRRCGYILESISHILHVSVMLTMISSGLLAIGFLYSYYFGSTVVEVIALMGVSYFLVRRAKIGLGEPIKFPNLWESMVVSDSQSGQPQSGQAGERV